MTDKLSDHQLEAFDTELINERLWAVIARCIDRDFPTGRFSFVDLGGGNGVFADRVLSRYPNSTGIVLDASDLLTSRNTPSARKRVIRADAFDIEKHCSSADIVFCNWLLHHLVTTGSRNESLANIRHVLTLIRRVLGQRGRLSIYENDYCGYIDSFPSRAIFFLTSSRPLALLMRSLGANTAGVGVCFQSTKGWVSTLQKAGFDVLAHTTERTWKPKRRHAALLIRQVGFGHYWAQAK
jgi:hypothetical protein